MIGKQVRIVAVSVVTLLVGSLVGCGRDISRVPASVASPSVNGGIAAAHTLRPPAAIRYPVRGTGTFAVAPIGSAIAGRHGRLLRYRIAVEHGITGISPRGFARSVAGILGDPRSWIGTHRWRLQLVAAGARYDFTIYLATPATRDVLCRGGYDRYTSCRREDKVVINVARWVHGVPDYGAGLLAYREYMINHETGHRLYNGHELCPGPGKLAPVMEQQTLGLHGCRPNSWPMVSGRPYHGMSGQYRDPTPKV